MGARISQTVSRILDLDPGSKYQRRNLPVFKFEGAS